MGAIAKPLGAVERVLVGGDLSQLNEQERLNYYKAICDSLGLNSLTKPFAYLHLNGKLQLYALRDCADQLRKIHNVSVQIVARESVEGVYVVTARAKMPDGREDESVGAVPIVREADGKQTPLKPDDRANAMMKAETKSKRRVTLSICGLGMLDETELETIPEVKARQAAVREEKLAQLEAPAQLPEELEALFGPDAPKRGTTTAFEICRRELMEANPEIGEQEYHRLLEHNSIKREGGNSIAKVRQCVTQMWVLAQSLKNLKAKAKPNWDLGVSEDDIPSIGPDTGYEPKDDYRK